MEMNVRVDMSDGSTRSLPFRFGPMEDIYLDTTVHRYKVLYRDGSYSYFADEGRARKEANQHGAVLQILNGGK